MINKTLVVNGQPTQIIVDSEQNLAKVLREQLGLLGTKIGCGNGQCGSCSVLMDGKVVRSCVTKMRRVPDGAEILTIEGIGKPDSLHPLQKAFIKHGASQCGYCIPGFIVSAKGLLDDNLNPEREEVRSWFQRHRNVCRCNGYKPAVDAVIDAARVMRKEAAPESLGFQMLENNSIWNTKYPRPSALAKVTGTCDYGADLGLKLPQNTLQLALVQATVSHAKILSIDTSEAEKMPGVYRILTHKDVKGNNRIFGFVLYPWSKNDGYDRPILCDEKIFQFGDALAIVCADTNENARAAAAKVKVEYEELPAYMNALAAAAEDAQEIHPGVPNIYFTQYMHKGMDVDAVLDKAPYVVEDNFYVQRQPHLTIEPDVGFSYLDEGGVVVVQSKSITVFAHHAMICDGLGLPPEKLRIIQNPTGSTFGYKLSPTLEAFCAVATMATGRPAYLEYDYYQHITYTGKRSPVFMRAKVGADKDGKLLALKQDFYMDHGAYSEFGDLLTIKILRSTAAGYHIPNIYGVGRAVFTNHAFGSAFRGYGSPQAEFASEVLMDELCEKMNMDRWEFRYKNVYRPGSTAPTGEELDVHPLPELLEMMKPKYEEALERARQESTAEKKRGVGITIGVYNVGRDTADGGGIRYRA